MKLIRYIVDLGYSIMNHRPVQFNYSSPNTDTYYVCEKESTRISIGLFGQMHVQIAIVDMVSGHKHITSQLPATKEQLQVLIDQVKTGHLQTKDYYAVKKLDMIMRCLHPELGGHQPEYYEQHGWQLVS